MTPNPTYQLRQYSVASGTPVIVVVPIDCNFVSIRNAGSVTVKIVTDDSHDNAWDDLKAGVQIVIGGMRNVFQNNYPGMIVPSQARFLRDSTFCSLTISDGETQQGDVRIGFVL